MSDHKLHECSGGENCDCNGYVCRGGLAYCDVCGGAEGSLPTDCPGKRLTADQQDDVYKAKIDYIEPLGWIDRHPYQKDTCPCWLCGFDNGNSRIVENHCCCSVCGVRMRLFYPLQRPLGGPPWRWARPLDIKPAEVVLAAETWQEVLMHKEKPCRSSTPTSS